MKKIIKKIVTLCCLLFTLVSFSQQITLEKGKYYVGGNQISTRETRQLLTSNVQALTLFKQAKSKEGLGGLFLGFGIALTVGDLAVGLFSDRDYPSTISYVGLGAIAISIPILSGRKRKIEKAIAIYNKENSGMGVTNSTFELHAVTNQNGMGIQIKF